MEGFSQKDVRICKDVVVEIQTRLLEQCFVLKMSGSDVLPGHIILKRNWGDVKFWTEEMSAGQLIKDKSYQYLLNIIMLAIQHGRTISQSPRPVDF